MTSFTNRMLLQGLGGFRGVGHGRTGPDVIACIRFTIRPECVVTVKQAGKPKLTYQAMKPSALASEGLSPGQLTPSVIPRVPTLSKSDEEFRSQKVEFVFGHEGIDLAELNKLFEDVGFPKRDLDKLQKALVHTHCVLWIRATTKSRYAREGQLIGFARATSDGALSATIWDVAVNPGWQRIGLGRGAVERLTASLVRDGITTISLYAEPGVVGLYTRLGFVQDPDGTKGMAFQRKSKAGAALLAA